MGWVPDDQHARFFHWKHRDNPAGVSPMWVATDGEKIVGLRTFLRWQFHDGHQPTRAVRAVDTATHPDYQGRGIFTLLTRHAMGELATEGVAFVFNTPNDRSRPGYLKMGWQEVGRLPVASRPRSLGSLARLVRARTPAGKWSLACDAGDPADEALADGAPVPGLGDGPTVAPGAEPGLATARTRAHLQWRYGFSPLHYRLLSLGRDPAEGVAIFRLRPRGPVTEAAVCELLLPEDSPASRRKLLRQVVRRTGADHAVVLGPAHPTSGLLPVPGQGPTLTYRAVASTSHDTPPLSAWHLSLGDIELF